MSVKGMLGVSTGVRIHRDPTSVSAQKVTIYTGITDRAIVSKLLYFRQPPIWIILLDRVHKLGDAIQSNKFDVSLKHKLDIFFIFLSAIV